MNANDPLPPPAESQEIPPTYEPHAEPVDPRRLAALERVRNGHQSLVGAIIGGLLGAVIGAGAWAGITIATQYQIGFMAIGVGILVGWLVRKLGHGMTPAYGVIGAVFALLGCLAGNLLTVEPLAKPQRSKGGWSPAGLQFDEMVAACCHSTGHRGF